MSLTEVRVVSYLPVQLEQVRLMVLERLEELAHLLRPRGGRAGVGGREGVRLRLEIGRGGLRNVVPLLPLVLDFQSGARAVSLHESARHGLVLRELEVSSKKSLEHGVRRVVVGDASLREISARTRCRNTTRGLPEHPP